MPYTTVEAMRAQGIDEDEVSDLELETAIENSSQYTDLVTGQWFEARTKQLVRDGGGGKLLVLEVPIITVTGIDFRPGPGSSWSSQSLDYFAIYNENPEDLSYPRIKMAGVGRAPSLYGGEFPKGPQTVRVSGTFGYTTEDGNTPGMVVLAVQMLTALLTGKVGTGQLQRELRKAGIVEEETYRHRYKLAESMASGGLTGIPYIDSILRKYTRKGSAGHV